MRRTPESWLMVALSVALAVVVTLVGSTPLSAQKGKTTPGYALHQLAIPAGWTRASAFAINDRHEIVGTVGPSSSQRAVYWSNVDAAPVLLPCFTDPCVSAAQAININGVIAGSANGQAVLWRWSGSAWSIEALPFPGTGNPDYRSSASGLLDDGTAVGFYSFWMGVMYPNDIPVWWHPSGAWSEYPVPEEYFAGRALRVNLNGDAVGELSMNDGRDPTYHYGVIWIQQGSSYTTLVVTDLVNGITPRFADGSFFVSSTGGRIRVSPSGAGWTYAIDSAAGGSGGGINRLGDMAGTQPKKGWTGYGGLPYLFTVDGTLIKLPLPSGATGVASGVSADRWVVGDFVKQGGPYPAAWSPQ